MTSYRLPHYGSRSFTFASDDALPSGVILNGARILCEKTGNEIVTQSEESITRMTSLTDSSGHLCPTPFQIYACKKDSHLCKSFPFISSFLSSRAASGQVLSAFVSLTSVFGMDTGDPHSCRHCFSERLFSQNHIEEVLKLFACLGVPKLRPRPISFMSLQALRLFHS